MYYPFFRGMSLFLILAIAGFAWQWSSEQPAMMLGGNLVQTKRSFPVTDLEVGPTVVENLKAAKDRPLFTPGRKPFVAAPPPPPIDTPPAISVVQETPLQTELPPQNANDGTQANGEEIPAIAQATVQDSPLQLKGIVVNGETMSALIVSREDPAGKWLKVGETVTGWKVTKIEKTAVFLRLGNTSANLQLYVENQAN